MIDRRKLTERQRLALEKCNIDGKGLEIGPSINPIAPKCQGFNVDILDHLDKKGLIKKYDGQPNIPENLENIIEEVDFVWTGQKYVELIGKKEHYDYIISSHLIEHTPNLIQHLNDCSELLKSVNGGGI